MNPTMHSLEWIEKYWKLISFVAWLAIGSLILFADTRYAKTEDTFAANRELEKRVMRLEIQFSVINSQLGTLNSNQLRMMEKLNVL